MKIDNKYSMIIPTYNRPVLLKRLISYLSNKQVGFQIFVLDSSSNEDTKRDNKCICANTNLKIAYFDYPSEIIGKDKVLDGLKKVDTEYMSFCADDDIVFPDSIKKCLDFLVDNADYAGCHAYYLNFTNINDKECQISLEYSSPSIDGNSFSERSLQLMLKYEAIFYAVFRTDVLRNSFKQIENINSFMFQELFLSLTPLIAGKVKRLNFIYYGRRGADPHELLNRSKWHPYEWFADNPEELIEEYLVYRDTLLNYMKNNGHDLKDIEKYKKLINLVHAAYFVNTTESERAHFSDRIRTDWNIQVPQQAVIEFPIYFKLLGIIRKYVGFFSGKYALEKSFRFKNPDGSSIFYRIKYPMLKQIGSVELNKILKEMTVYFGENFVQKNK